ncbi:hypothetical protein [Candidatus Cytomitobacter primus]|uniref:Uncharacterized protein n=1 Tax=Candidatus Cytomitobacter primus TaxID=2066024 RepID=A0A5C0UFV8_9PROT|nr:hypothetical protein [Candidatus Cytomitobacter primus]QEK38679.1 hypothetical protein FZC34_02035 [Candidatus Cytomitobacter primus]
MNKILFVGLIVSMLHGTGPDLPVKEYVTVADNGSLVIDAPDFSSHDIKAPCFKPGKVIREYWCDVRGLVSVHEQSVFNDHEDHLAKSDMQFNNLEDEIAHYESLLSKDDPYFSIKGSHSCNNDLNPMHDNSNEGLSERSTSNSMGHESDEVAQGHKSTEAYMIDKNVLNSSSVNTVYVELNKLADFKA